METEEEIIIRPASKSGRKIGADKGSVDIADDFDAPLEDFKEYMF